MKEAIQLINKVLDDSISYANRSRSRGAYMFLNSGGKHKTEPQDLQEALRIVCSQLVVGGVPTTNIVRGDDVFKIEPMFDNDGKYVCEEVVYLGRMDDKKGVSCQKISSDFV